MGDIITIVLATMMVLFLGFGCVISFKIFGLLSIPIIIYAISAIVGYLMIILGTLGVLG